MTQKIIIILLIIALIYLYYQNRKLAQLPHSFSPDNSERTIFHLDENQEELIADRDTTIREKKEAEADALDLSNKLKLKQQEVTRKDQAIERIKSEKNRVEVNLNKKITELKKELQELKTKYSKQAQLLDEEQTDNNKLTEKVETLEEQIKHLKKQLSWQGPD